MSLSSKKRLDFSVIIPTYNRSQFVRQAIISVLRQKNVSLEIIVSDDGSTDDTEKVIKQLKDKRIRYSKNKERLGSSMNMRKSFLLTKGDYIFTLGDDDFILNEDTLFGVLKVMKKYKVGMGRIGSISYEKSPKYPYQAFILTDKLVVLKPDNKEDILVRATGAELGYYSGIIFNNHFIDKARLKMNHKCYPNHICLSYHSAAYDLIQRHGIVYIPNHFIIARLSLQMIPIYYNLEKHRRSFMNEALILIKGFMDDKDYERYKRLYLRKMISILPNIKLHTDNKNLFNFLNILIKDDVSLLIDPRFYFFALAGFLPKIAIKSLRRLMINYSILKMKKTVEKYNYFQKLDKLRLSL